MRCISKANVALVAALLSGCVPLEQAPLVYSSANQIGVGVAAGTPDSPGLDVNIGYKGLDAAFVPVAVAKKCTAPGTCPTANYNINVVRGSNNLSDQSLFDANQEKKYQSAIDAADHAMTEAATAIAAEEKSISDIATLQTKQDKLAGLQSAAAAAKAAQPNGAVGAPATAQTPPSTEVTQAKEIASLSAEITRIQALAASQDNITNDVVAQKAKLAKAAAEKNLAQNNLSQILARADTRTGDVKSDAFSVYGSFNGRATGNTQGAGLGLGKVFSTGIAAQNVSQGIKDASRIEAVTKCMQAAKELLGTSTDSTLMTTLALSCQTKED